MTKRARSLDGAAAGETVTVRQILFDTLRSHCFERGVREGVRVRVRAGDGERLRLQPAGGTEVPCERRLARFIQVSSAPDDGVATAEASGGESGDDDRGA